MTQMTAPLTFIFLPLLVGGSDDSEGTCPEACRNQVENWVRNYVRGELKERDAKLETLRSQLLLRDSQVDDLMSRLEMRDSQMQALYQQLRELNQTLTYRHMSKRQPPILSEVGFSASVSLPRNNKVGANDIVTFRTVLTNLGNHYDPGTGVFLAPVSGTYQFFVTIMADRSNYIETRLMHNGRMIAEIYSGAIQNFGTGSNHVVVSLNRGDRVWVQVNEAISSNFMIHCCWSTFSGYLLFQA